MSTFVTIMGWLCIALICAAITAGAVGFAAQGIRRSLERFEWAVDAKTRHAVGRAIGASAHWFGESHETALALRILAERLIHDRGIDASGWREDWRRARVGTKE